MTDHHDVSLTVPARWHRRQDPAHGIVLAARARTVPPSGFPPEVVVRSTPIDEDLQAWRAGAMTELATQLVGFALEDEDAYDLGPHRVDYRRFGHRFGILEVLCDQWSWLVDGLGVTMTCSVAREDYPAYCDLFEEIAGTVDVLPRVA